MTKFSPLSHGWPSPQQQEAARRAMYADEVDRARRDRENRLNSMMIALRHFGKDALYNNGVTEKEREQMQRLIDDGFLDDWVPPKYKK